jgi:phage protein U
MMTALGMFVFERAALPFDERQRRSDWRHAANGRVGARDALQFVGPGEDVISLSGTAYAELSDGEASLDQLRELADEGEAQPLIDDDGVVVGYYVIAAIDERRKNFGFGGRALSIDFGIDLRRAPDPA